MQPLDLSQAFLGYEQQIDAHVNYYNNCNGMPFDPIDMDDRSMSTVNTNETKLQFLDVDGETSQILPEEVLIDISLKRAAMNCYRCYVL